MAVRRRRLGAVCTKLKITDVKRNSVTSTGFLDNGDSQAGENLGFEKADCLGLGCNETVKNVRAQNRGNGIRRFGPLQNLGSPVPGRSESAARDHGQAVGDSQRPHRTGFAGMESISAQTVLGSMRPPTI
jgi:hypothetical protein